MDSSRALKKKFLVVYDYGQGGVWAYVLARSEDEVMNHFPELQVVHEPPDWMSELELKKLANKMTFDLEKPKEGLLADILTARQHRRWGGPSATTAR